MTHRAEQILDAAVAAIPTTAQRVYKHRRDSLSDDEQELPATSVDEGDDQPVDDDGALNLAFLDSMLTVETTAYASALTEHELKAELSRLRVINHKAMMSADRTLGLDFVIDVKYAGAAAPEIERAGEKFVGRRISRWSVHYRMNLTDPE